MPKALPSLSLSGMPSTFTLSWVLDSTLMYHWAQVWAPTWSLTYWLLSPKTSMVSLKDFTLA